MNDVKFILCISMFILFVLALICHNIDKKFLVSRVTQLEQRVLALEVK